MHQLRDVQCMCIRRCRPRGTPSGTCTCMRIRTRTLTHACACAYTGAAREWHAEWHGGGRRRRRSPDQSSRLAGVMDATPAQGGARRERGRCGADGAGSYMGMCMRIPMHCNGHMHAHCTSVPTVQVHGEKTQKACMHTSMHTYMHTCRRTCRCRCMCTYALQVRGEKTQVCIVS